MSKVTVYRFEKYDITSDTMRTSQRWATRGAIAEVRGKVLEDTAIEVDADCLKSEIEGMTPRDFNPTPRRASRRRSGDGIRAQMAARCFTKRRCSTPP